MEAVRLILVRATVNLPGFKAGTRQLADATSPYVANCLEHGYLVPVATRHDGGSR